MPCNSSFAVFCDDIRHEKTGKLSLIGVYGSHMFVGEFPTRLPKLCVHFSIRLSKVEMTNGNHLSIRLKRGSEIVSEMSFGSDFSFPEDLSETDEGMLSGAIELPFLELVEPFKFTVEFFNGDKESSIGELIISKGSEVG